MNEEQPEKSSDAGESQHQMGLMLQRRALYREERASEKPPRSPKQIALVSLMVVATMTLFLLMMDKGVKVMHRIIDIWTPAIFDSKHQASSQSSSASVANPATPYMIKVEPAPRSQDSPSSASATTNR